MSMFPKKLEQMIHRQRRDFHKDWGRPPTEMHISPVMDRALVYWLKHSPESSWLLSQIACLTSLHGAMFFGMLIKVHPLMAKSRILMRCDGSW